MKKIKHTTWQLIAADHLDASVDEIQILGQKSFRYQVYILMRSNDQAGLLKILPNGYKQSSLLELYDYENELTALDLLKRKTKLVLPQLIEYNTSFDILQNEYLFYQIPENTNFIDAYEEHTLAQMQEWTTQIQSISQNQFCMNIEENDLIVNWSSCFQTRWNKIITELVACQLLNNKETELSAQFFNAIQPTLHVEASAIFTNPGFTDQTILFNPPSNRIQPFDFTLSQWAPPEFSYARSDYLQLGNWEPVKKYKNQLASSLELKARYFLYFVSFCLEDALLHHLCAKSWENMVQRKKMAFTLIENALQG